MRFVLRQLPWPCWSRLLAPHRRPAQAEFDIQAFIDAQTKAGQHRIVVPSGRYRVTPRHGTHVLLKDLADTVIVADGVEMVCTQTCRALVFENCRNVCFRGLTVDFDPLPFTEGRIVAMAPDKRWVEFEIIEGYPEHQLQERIEIYDPATTRLRRETAGWSKEFESLGNHRYRATKPQAYRYQEDWDTEHLGDILVTAHSFPNGTGGHAITATRCRGLRLEDITLYAASSFGFLEHDCDGSTYLRCKIDRRDPASDPVKRGLPRMRSLNADAFHSVGAGKGPAILQCTAKYQGDDCVNIHGTYHLVTGCHGAELRVAALGQLTIEPGDPVEFLPYEGRRPADAVAVKIEPDGPITEEEKAFLRTINILPRHKELLLAGKAKFFKLTLGPGRNTGHGFGGLLGQAGGERLCGEGLRFRIQPVAGNPHQGQPRRGERQHDLARLDGGSPRGAGVLVVRVGQFQRRGDSRQQDHRLPPAGGRDHRAGRQRQAATQWCAPQHFHPRQHLYAVGLAQHSRHLDRRAGDSGQPPDAPAAGDYASRGTTVELERCHAHGYRAGSL